MNSDEWNLKVFGSHLAALDQARATRMQIEVLGGRSMAIRARSSQWVPKMSMFYHPIAAYSSGGFLKDCCDLLSTCDANVAAGNGIFRATLTIAFERGLKCL